MTILLIGAHPDDEISAGGTITNHTRAGDRVVVLTATKGGMGHRTRPTHELIPIREKEAAAAAKTMGAELRMLDYPDGNVPVSTDLVNEIARHIRDIRPDIIITLSDETFHPDHDAIHHCALKAYYAASLPLLTLGLPAWDVPCVLYYAEDVYRKHDLYVDITDTIDTKIAAGACHASQYTEWLAEGGSSIDGWDYSSFDEAFRRECRIYGGHCGVMYAEAFDYMRPPAPRALKLLKG